MPNLVAHASTTIAAPPDKVWHALTDPDTIKRYFFGTTLRSDWKEGGSITWSGEWRGRQYEDKGVILQFRPPRLLQYTHFSPLSGVPDTPENYHTVTVELSGDGHNTQVSLSQDNNASEQARDHSAKNWEMVLAGLKKVLEE